MFSKCGHNSYWQAFDGACMACRAEQAEARVQTLEQELVHQRDPGRQQQDERIFTLEQEKARLREALVGLLVDCCDLDQDRVAIVEAKHALEGG